MCDCSEELNSTISLKQIQMPLRVSAKTSDNTTMQLDIMVQYAINESEEGIYSSKFKLNDPVAQIRKYVEDVVRTKVADTTMNGVFESKDYIASEIKAQLKDTMEKFGYDIRETPVTNVDPPTDVKASMNAKNTKRFIFQATEDRTKMEKLLRVAKADAEKEKSLLVGRGIAKQRTAIAFGLNDTVVDFKSEIGGVSARDVLELVLIIQYFDMMKDIGGSQHCNTTFVPKASSGGEEMMRNAILTAGKS